VIAGEAHRRMRGLPFAPLSVLTGGSSPLILAPHPDDESLGCGGLIASCVAADMPPVVAFLTDGTGSHPGSRSHPPAVLCQLREQEARDAAGALGLGADNLAFLRLPDRFAPQDGPEFEAAVTQLADLATARNCAVLFAPWRHDPHCDHAAAHLLVCELARRTGLAAWSYPVWGWTLPEETELDAAPAGVRLDISRHLPAKRAAIAAHRSQHGGVITDDPDGFVLPADMLGYFDRPYEVFLDPI
jgi:LmbE family N-acetylglucosaminyl deacetylase